MQAPMETIPVPPPLLKPTASTEQKGQQAPTVKAVSNITSDKKVGSVSFTPGANVIYEAGKSITLEPGFVAEKWSVFKAEIKTCP